MSYWRVRWDGIERRRLRRFSVAVKSNGLNFPKQEFIQWFKGIVGPRGAFVRFKIIRPCTSDSYQASRVKLDL